LPAVIVGLFIAAMAYWRYAANP